MQTQEELKDIYVAWKMGASIEHKHQSGKRWVDHDDYAEIRYVLHDYFIHRMAVRGISMNCGLEFRIKGDDDD